MATTTRNKSHVYVWNKAALMNINPKTTDAVLGLFEPSHLQYEEERNKETGGLKNER
jgi:alkaline phosphatase